MIEVNDVIQVNENNEKWCGCLAIVEELRPFGVSAYLYVPHQGTIYLRLAHDEFDYIGKAKIIYEIE